MSRFSRDKGARLELEACEMLRRHGYPDARRRLGQERDAGGRDLDGTPGLCPQVKGGRTPEPLRAWEEAEAASRPGEIAVAFVRRDRGVWLAVVEAVDLLDLVAIAKAAGDAGARTGAIAGNQP